MRLVRPQWRRDPTTGVAKKKKKRENTPTKLETDARLCGVRRLDPVLIISLLHCKDFTLDIFFFLKARGNFCVSAVGANACRIVEGKLRLCQRLHVAPKERERERLILPHRGESLYRRADTEFIYHTMDLMRLRRRTFDSF